VEGEGKKGEVLEEEDSVEESGQEEEEGRKRTSYLPSSSVTPDFGASGGSSNVCVRIRNEEVSETDLEIVSRKTKWERHS
jgi:hypothetical protein